MVVGQRFCFVFLIALAGAACHTRSPSLLPSSQPVISASRAASAPPTVAPSPPAPPARTTPAARPSPASLTEEDLFRVKSLDELNAEHPLADTFFDYDQITLRDDARAALQQDAAWLAKWPGTIVKVEGSCDERGSAEYNLALGQQRAAVVKAYLESLGVQPNRLVTMSLGKEAPFCRESNESCWATNRRGHFIITRK